MSEWVSEWGTFCVLSRVASQLKRNHTVCVQHDRQVKPKPSVGCPAQCICKKNVIWIKNFKWSLAWLFKPTNLLWNCPRDFPYHGDLVRATYRAWKPRQRKDAIARYLGDSIRKWIKWIRLYLIKFQNLIKLHHNSTAWSWNWILWISISFF